MDNIKFKTWLEKEKQFSNKSAKDVISRLNRIGTIIKLQDNISLNTIDLLNNSNKFNSFGIQIKSQLKRAITLYVEFQNNQDKNKSN